MLQGVWGGCFLRKRRTNCTPVMIYTGLPALKQHRIPSGATVSKVKCTICSQYMFLGMLAKEQVVCCSIASRGHILFYHFTCYLLLQLFPMRWMVIFWPWLVLSVSWEKADQQMQTGCIANIRCWNTQWSIKVIKEGCNKWKNTILHLVYLTRLAHWSQKGSDHICLGFADRRVLRSFGWFIPFHKET